MPEPHGIAIPRERKLPLTERDLKTMKYTETTITATAADKITTEIYFAEADARIRGCEILRMNLSPEAAKRQYTIATRILKEKKKEGKILFFAPSDRLAEDTMENRYLGNKYPEFMERLRTENADAPFILVRI